MSSGGDAPTRLDEVERLAGIGTFELGPAGTPVVWSPGLHRLHVTDPRTFTPTLERVMDLIDPRDRARVTEWLAAARRGEAVSPLRYRICRDGDRAWRTFEARVSEPSAGQRLLGVVEDVTEREESRRRLAASEARYRVLVELANDGIWILDPEGRTSFANRRLSEMLGREFEEILGRSPDDFTDEHGRRMLAVARTDPSAVAQFEARFRRGDGSELWTLSAVAALPAEWAAGTMLVVSDITAHRAIEDQMRHAALHDALTGLSNRAAFDELVQCSLDDCRDADKPLSLLLLDLDHFKFVNDSFNHALGDALLAEIAQAFEALCDEGRRVARLGGDEFAFVLPGHDERQARRVAEDLLRVVRDRRWQSLSRLTASIGVAVAEEPRSTAAAQLLVAADVALYQAKAAGRDRLAVYAGAGGGLTWVEEIRAALDEDRLVLYSQPIVALRSGPPREELLVRMVGRNGQLIPPGAFIPTAEQYGLIRHIDRWVVEQGLGLARSGRGVEINLSGASLGDEHIRRRVKTAIRRGVRPELLTFEVTETAMARNLDAAQRFAAALRGLGCSFALDDFGTGFGGLTYLKHLPVTQVKIDIEFVRHLARDDDAQRIVRAVVAMAGELGHETVAEGVEDAETLDLLHRFGVDYAQGYFIGRPAPAITARGPVVRTGGGA